MLMSTESDSEADDVDAKVLRCLTELTPSLSAAWDKDAQRYNAELTATVHREEQQTAAHD
jgi:hypothetical protein